MRYTARKMGQHAMPIPDAVFETWDGKVIRSTPEHCWAIGQDIKDIMAWAKKNFWALSISNEATQPPMTSHKLNVRRTILKHEG